MSASIAVLIVVVTLSAVLLTSGVAKLRDARATRDAFDALRVPAIVPADAAARALPWVEIALALLLVVAPRDWLVPVAAALLLLMLSYTLLVARALTFDDAVSCSCFGSLGRHEIDRTTLGRNVLLSILAGVVVWAALDERSAPASFADLDAGGWWALVAAAAAVTVALLVVGADRGEPTTRSDQEPIDYQRQPIPYGVVNRVDGEPTTLAEMAASQARLLIILNAHCAPCVRTAAQADAWAERLAPAVGVVVVYPHEEVAAAPDGHAADLSVWEPDLNVRRLLGVGAPSAVLLGADGMLAGGPVTGEDAVVELVEDVLDEIMAQS